MAWVIGLLGIFATIAGVMVMVCYVLRMVTLVGCVLLIVPFIGMVATSLIVGGIALFAFAQIFGAQYYAGSIAGAGIATLACGYFLTRNILSAYRRAAGIAGRMFGKYEND
jgi:hypothetical protein